MRFKFIIFIFLLVTLKAFSVENGNYIVKLKNSKLFSQSIEKYKLPTIQAKPILSEMIDAFEKNQKNRVLSSEQTIYLNELGKYYLINSISSDDYELIKSFDEVESIVPNYIYSIDSISSTDFRVPNDAGYQRQWGLTAVKAETAWKFATGKGVIVGVVDTGIDYEHPDLKNSLWINTKEDINNSGYFEPWPYNVEIDGVRGDLNGIDDDGNGFIDDVIGYDFVDQLTANVGDYSKPDSNPMDENGHGSLVSGIIAAETNNKIGIAGLAFNAKIIAIRAFDAGGNAESDDIARAIVYGAINGAKVMNFSFGEKFYSPIIHDAVRFAYSLGCTMVSSSGNNNSDEQHYPSDHEEVITVGSANQQGERAFRSNYGSMLRLIAPGQEILSTNLGGGYRTADGTSMASPFVAGAAALLLEKNPSLSPADINGILQASATDLGEPGWDIYTGSGLLNLEKAFEIEGSSNLSINYPSQAAFFNRSQTKEFPFAANVVTPFFKSWQLFIGAGKNPGSWQAITKENFEQTLNDTIARINIEILQDTVYTARVLIKLANNNTIERRVLFNLVSEASPLEIKGLTTVNAYIDDRRVVLVAAETNQPSAFSIMYRPDGTTQDYKRLSEVERNTTDHFLIIDSRIPENVKMEGIVLARRQDGFVVSDTFSFICSGKNVPTSDFISKKYSIPLSYLHNQVKDLYGDGKPSIVVNDISELVFGNLVTYKFDGENFVKKDDSEELWVPAGIGDSNGDGIPEIFATGSGKSILYQGNSKGANPFSGALLKGLTKANFWGEAMYDLTGDGNEELIAYNDEAFFAMTYKDKSYQVLATASLDTNLLMLGTAEGAAIGDFDGDGKTELCHGDKFGNIHFFEFDNNKFTKEYTYKLSPSDGPNYICRLDLEGDGKYEVLVMNSTSSPLYKNGNGSERIWKASIFKSIGVNRYEVIWEEYFYGVREGVIGNLGFSYKNGVSAGNIDNQPGDEIIISTFPNLYIFKYDVATNKVKPLWWYPSAFANSALVYDFDGNGINDIGFGTFADTRFFEYDGGNNRAIAPSGFEGWATGLNSVFLQWDEVEGADFYKILQVFRNNNVSIEEVAETDKINIDISGLQANQWYEYAIVTVDNSKENKISNPTYSVDVFTHSLLEPDSVQIVDNSTLKVFFSGNLPSKPLESGDFIVVTEDEQKEILAHSAIAESDIIVLLKFDNDIDSGNYNLHILSFKDKYNSPSLEKKLQFTLKKESSNQKELYLARLEVIDGQTLMLRYSEAVVRDDAENTANYFLSRGGTIASVEQDPMDKSLVIINLESGPGVLGPLGKNYFLTVSNVVAESGNPMTKGAGNTLGFVFSADNNRAAFVYPNPIHLNDNPEIYFANISANAEVTILNLEGKVIRVLSETDGNGGIEWNGRDNKANLLQSGVYLFKVKDLRDKDKESRLKKFVVVR